MDILNEMYSLELLDEETQIHLLTCSSGKGVAGILSFEFMDGIDERFAVDHPEREPFSQQFYGRLQ
jgi:hypothetical protein